MADEKPLQKFTDFLTRLVRVPKEEIDEKEVGYRAARKANDAAEPGKIVKFPPEQADRTR